MTTNDGYAARHPVGITVRADNLEIAAGWPNERRVDSELAYALATLNRDHPTADELRWLAVCIAAKLDYMDAQS